VCDQPRPRKAARHGNHLVKVRNPKSNESPNEPSQSTDTPATRPARFSGGAPSAPSPYSATNSPNLLPPTPIFRSAADYSSAGYAPTTGVTFSAGRSEGRRSTMHRFPRRWGHRVLAWRRTILNSPKTHRAPQPFINLSADKKIIYYSAHLNRYAGCLTVEHLPRQGEAIAYVGDTGNAGAGKSPAFLSFA